MGFVDEADCLWGQAAGLAFIHSVFCRREEGGYWMVYDVHTRGIGVGGTAAICCGSLRIAFAYPRCCCLDWRRAVLRQPIGRLIGIEVMVSCG